MDLSIVIPTYNEKDNVEEIVRQIDQALNVKPETSFGYEILFVDDSKDETPEIISRISAVKPYVKLKHRVNEKGLATAVLDGFRLSEGQYVAVMDADLQHPPKTLRGMYAALKNGNADMCIPSRLIPGGYDGGLNWYRKIVSGTARVIGQVLLPCLRPVSDPTSGLFMFRRSIIEHADMRPIGWKIMIEVLAMAKYDSIIEIPYTFQDRNAGKSKLDSKVTLQYLQQCFSLRKRYVRNEVRVQRWSTEQTDEAVNIIFS